MMSASATTSATRRIADLGLDDLDGKSVRAQTVEIAAVAAVAVDQRVDDANTRTLTNQLMGDVRADEPKTAGDHADGGRQVGVRLHPTMLEMSACKDR